MSGCEWKPGDVVIAGHGSNGEFVMVRTTKGTWACSGAGYEHNEFFDDTRCRPLVVIDPEDREQVGRLVSLWFEFANRFDGSAEHPERMAAALRELANPTPPKPEVYEHIAATLDQGITTALCGKVWRAGEDVKVVGKCPECSEMVETGWIA